MKIETLEAVQAHFNTENEHYNNWMFELTTEAIQGGHFSDIEQALQLFDFALEAALQEPQQPLNAMMNIQKEFDRNDLNSEQALFVWDALLKYIRNSEFGELDLTDFKVIATSYAKRIRNQRKTAEATMKAQLANIVEKELQQLPSLLDKMEPEKRLAVVCKLLQFTISKDEVLPDSSKSFIIP